MKRAIVQQLGIGAVYTAVIALPERATAEYRRLLEFIESGKKDHRLYRQLLNAYHTKAEIRRVAFHNLSPTVGRTSIAMRLANDTTYTGIVTRIGIGSGTNSPAVGDTTLQTETYRTTFNDTSFINNVAYLSAFIAAGVATGTYNEAGLFIDGTGVADSGQLLSRVLFSPPITKGALTSLTLEATLTVS